MRPLLAFLIFVTALGSGTAFARVGETLDQCKKRYGKAFTIPAVYDFGTEARELFYFGFEKNGIAIVIGFLNGKAADLSFHHSNSSAPLTQVEIDTLLAANANAMHWKTITDGKLIFFPDTPAVSTRYGNYQQRDDGVMSTVDGATLHIFTPEWFAYANDKMKIHADRINQDQKKNLEDF